MSDSHNRYTPMTSCMEWNSSRKCVDAAQDAVKRLKANPSRELREQIASSASISGRWDVWMCVFENEDWETWILIAEDSVRVKAIESAFRLRAHHRDSAIVGIDVSSAVDALLDTTVSLAETVGCRAIWLDVFGKFNWGDFKPPEDMLDRFANVRTTILTEFSQVPKNGWKC